MSNVEANEWKGEVDDQGWPKEPPISDRKCIYLCLSNCEQLAGLDKKVMGDIAAGTYTSYDCYDSTGRHYTKLVIEYEEPKTR